LCYFCMHRADESTAGSNCKRIYAESAQRMTRAHELIALTFFPDASIVLCLCARGWLHRRHANKLGDEISRSNCLLRWWFYGWKQVSSIARAPIPAYTQPNLLVILVHIPSAVNLRSGLDCWQRNAKCACYEISSSSIFAEYVHGSNVNSQSNFSAQFGICLCFIGQLKKNNTATSIML